MGQGVVATNCGWVYQMNLEELRQWADIISALGSTGILAVFTLLFVRGDIVSKKTMETIVSQITENIVHKIDDLTRKSAQKDYRDSL